MLTRRAGFSFLMHDATSLYCSNYYRGAGQYDIYFPPNGYKRCRLRSFYALYELQWRVDGRYALPRVKFKYRRFHYLKEAAGRLIFTPDAPASGLIY